MLEDAAATNEAALEEAERQGFLADESQSLTLVFAGTRPSDGVCGENSERQNGNDPEEGVVGVSGWTVEELQHCLDRPAAGWSTLFKRDRSDDAGRLSLLWSQFVTGVGVEVDGDAAGGVVQFDRPGCFAGAVPFSMRKTSNGWSIVSFELLDAGWKVEREQGGSWTARRVTEVPVLPDLHHKSEFLEVRLKSEWGLPVVQVNREAVDLDDLRRLVADEVVMLRADDDVTGEQYRTVIEALQTAEPPVPALFTISKRMIDTCWCLLGFGGGARAPTPVEQLLADDSLASPFVDVPRSMLPRDAISLCVDSDGVSMKCPGRLQTSATESARYLVDTAAEAVGRQPDLPVLISVSPDARYGDVDIALDIAVQSATPHVYLATGPDTGVVFEIRHEVRRAPLAPMRRNDSAHNRPAAPHEVETNAASASIGHPRVPIRFVVNGPVTEPVKIDGPAAVYPEAARRARIQGVVVLDAIIDSDGRVEDLKILRGLPLGLTEAAIQAVKRWRYQPATLKGEAVSVRYTIPVRFKLE